MLIANAVPLLGVLFLGWDAFTIVALYWLENVVIGLFNALKMARCPPDGSLLTNIQSGTRDSSDGRKVSRGFSRIMWFGWKLFLIAFFCFHYGFFCMGHGMFVWILLGPGGIGDSMRGHIDGVHLNWSESLATFATPGMAIAVVGILVSHAISFATQHFGHRRVQFKPITDQMMEPYKRIVVLHVAIITAAFVINMVPLQLGLLIILIVGKTVYDGYIYREELTRTTHANHS